MSFKLISITILCLCLFCNVSYGQIESHWYHDFGAWGVDDESEYIGVDEQGNVYVTGTFQDSSFFTTIPSLGAFLLSNGAKDIFIHKLDSNGNFVWGKSIGGNFDEWNTATTLDNNANLYTMGTFKGTVDFDPSSNNYNLTSSGSGSIFIHKLDSDGNFIWAKSINPNILSYRNAITVDQYGYIYVVGTFRKSMDIDPSPNTHFLHTGLNSSMFILKLAPNGDFIWAKNIGDGNGTLANGHSISIDNMGNICLAGAFRGTIDFDPSIDTFNLTANATSDIFIAKFSPIGDFMWAKNMGSSGYNRANSLVIDAANNIYVAGIFVDSMDFDTGAGTNYISPKGGSDFFIQKFDPNGNVLWVTPSGGIANDFANSIKISHEGFLYITGTFADTIRFESISGMDTIESTGVYDIFVQKLDTSGHIIWTYNFGSYDIDRGNHIALDSNYLYVTGMIDFYTPLDMDGNALISKWKDTTTISSTISSVNTQSPLLSYPKYSIYPNPTFDQVYVSFDEPELMAEIIITDLLGKIISYEKVFNPEIISIEMDNNPSGTYFITVIVPNKRRQTLPFIKK